MDEKQRIRKEIALIKQSLSEQQVAELSQTITEHLLRTNEFQSALCVAIYLAIKGEVQTTGIIEAALKQNKRIVLPVINDGKMEFRLFTGAESLSIGAFGIAEPRDSALIQPSQIDLFIVPGIAFDRTGNRMGRGKGYYDKYLAEICKPIIGLCFGFQLFDSIPAESHDVKMRMIVSENGECRMENGEWGMG